MKRRIDIEQLVIWAYRDQMVHAARPEGAPVELGFRIVPRLAMSDLSSTPVDDSMKVKFEASTDAYVVHFEVMRLGTVDRVRTKEEIEIVIARAMAGNEVFGITWQEGSLNRESELRRSAAHAARRKDKPLEAELLGLARAEATERTLMAQRSQRSGVVIPRSERLSLSDTVFHCGLLGRRPNWWPHPVYDLLRDKPIYKGQRKEAVLYTLRHIGDDPLEVERHRSIYTHWREALGTLLARCESGFQNFELTKALPPAEPWSQQIP